MIKRKLGKTDLEVSRLGLGGLFLMSSKDNVSGTREALKSALRLGINYIDTAPGYGDSEKVIGVALDDISIPVILSTKLGGRPLPFMPRDKDCLLRSVEESLRLLARDSIDILMIHEPDRPGVYDWWTDMAKVEGPVLELLAELKRQGIIRYTGIGGTTAYELSHIVRSGKFDVVLTAFNYSLLWREAEHSVFTAAKEAGVGLICGSALQQGALAREFDTIYDSRAFWLSDPRRRQFKSLYSLAKDCGTSIPELALRFVISNDQVDCVLMGTGSVAEIEDNVEAVNNGPLPPDVLARLDEIYSQVPFRPFEEPFGIGWWLANPEMYKGPGQP